MSAGGFRSLLSIRRPPLPERVRRGWRKRRQNGTRSVIPCGGKSGTAGIPQLLIAQVVTAVGGADGSKSVNE